LRRQSGVALNPATPISVLDHVLTELDMVLIMSVNPGFEAQKFIPEVIPKIKSLREKIDNLGLDIEIEVDGGINQKTIGSVSAAGADVFVAGSAIYHSKDYEETMLGITAEHVKIDIGLQPSNWDV
jgi:ribulose-phosphate 3-epimerase